MGHYKPTPHVFGDVMDLSPTSLEGCATFAQKYAAIEEAPISTSSFCISHGGFCPVIKPVDVDVSGLPCQDSSKANKARKYFEGKHGQIFAVWCKHHRTQGTPLLLLENVPELRLQFNILIVPSSIKRFGLFPLMLVVTIFHVFMIPYQHCPCPHWS